MLRILITIPRYVVAGLIIAYQKTLSPDHGFTRALFPYGFCQFYPSCSEYGKVAVLKHGVFKGGAQALWRVVRCNPFKSHPSIETNN